MLVIEAAKAKGPLAPDHSTHHTCRTLPAAPSTVLQRIHKVTRSSTLPFFPRHTWKQQRRSVAAPFVPPAAAVVSAAIRVQ